MEKCDQMEKQGIRLHVAGILLIGVLGQNVTGQNVTDTMSQTKYYEDKMLLVKMSRHFVYDIWSTAYYQRHFVRDICPMTFCPHNILSGIFCPATFCPDTLVGIHPPCIRSDENGSTSNPNTGNSSNGRL